MNYKLTPKQKLFADEYLIDLNATRAYKAAYKSCKKDETANVNGSKLLRNTKVAKYIEERMNERSRRTEITQDNVLKELATIAFAKVTDFVTSLELLGRHLGMFNDKIEVSGTINNPMEGLTTDELKKLIDDD